MPHAPPIENVERLFDLATSFYNSETVDAAELRALLKESRRFVQARAGRDNVTYRIDRRFFATAIEAIVHTATSLHVDKLQFDWMPAADLEFAECYRWYEANSNTLPSSPEPEPDTGDDVPSYGVSYLDAALWLCGDDLRDAKQSIKHWKQSREPIEPIGCDSLGRGDKQSPDKRRSLFKPAVMVTYLENIGGFFPTQKTGLLKHLRSVARYALTVSKD